MSSVVPAASSGDLHPRLIAALSPPSHFYFTLWPLIIAKSPFLFRERTLRNVNHEFREYADSFEHYRSLQAKRRYMYQRMRKHRAVPVLALEGLPFDSVVEWRDWGAEKVRFDGVEAFRDFCALGDIDPDAVVKHDPYVSEHREMFLKSSQEDIDSRCHYIWSSRAKDILVFSTVNPLKTEGCCNFFGIVVWVVPTSSSQCMTSFMRRSGGRRRRRKSCLYTASG
ncbi:hypothetical protein BS47DRAFT_203229 [Hydnum rufescens UP504]|uniref:Uncharacterized protein n=1 Tax=Hydnum rufescens UP504 TaxID=1448309 RepID=A0A9P6AN41_9AGAM|nr:hypothetical protein BS47DRAFT_203229 [Hydnum rufescens UP504]